ncbi:DUF3011 domain-containing protein, partial [Stenotrophomonas sp.]|uniref:DUF3011 domain-containing protein n=1 Tax=Stenotrophomonas sp. TaxID=69392 RepID=UPI0025D2B423
MKPLSLASLAVTLSLGAAGTLALPAPSAHAQSGVVRCESQNNRERVCNTGWRNAQLVRQLSGSDCDEGRTWGSRNGSIWVTNGCRADMLASTHNTWAMEIDPDQTFVYELTRPEGR